MQASVRRAPQQGRSQERVALILQHTAACLAEKGVDATGMSDIARAAGLSLASIYRYFPNKTAIIQALAKRHVARLEATLRERLPGIDLAQGLDDLIDVYADFYRNEPGYHVIWSSMQSLPELAQIDQQELLANAQDIDAHAGHLFPGLPAQRRWMASILLPRACGAILRLSMTMPQQQADALLAELKLMVRAYLQQLVQSTQAKGASL